MDKRVAAFDLFTEITPPVQVLSQCGNLMLSRFKKLIIASLFILFFHQR